jgi:MFS family permease
MKINNSENTNIRVAYILSFLSELYFPIVAWLFFYLKFLDFKQIAILTAIHVLTSNLFEIPTGVFADLFGRKRAIFISFFACTFVMFAYPFNSLFWAFVVLEFLGGITNALLSGSLEALVYDTLKEDGEEARYNKVVANMQSLSWVGLFVSAIVGGFVYKIWFGTPWILQGIVFALAAIFALKLQEPRIDTQKYQLKMLVTQNVIGFKELFRNRKIAQTTMTFALIGVGYFIAAKILGPSQAREYGMDSAGVGLLFGTGYIISALASQAFPKLIDLLGEKKLLFVTVGMLIGSFIFAKFVGLALGSFLIIVRISSSTTFWNIESSILNPLIESKNRATSLSTFALLTQLPYALLAYTIGDTIDKTSPNNFALILGITLIMLLIIQQVVFHLMKPKIEPI